METAHRYHLKDTSSRPASSTAHGKSSAPILYQKTCKKLLA